MHVKKFMQVATAALCFVNLNAFAVQDFSALSPSESIQLKHREMVEDHHNQMREKNKDRIDEQGMHSRMRWNADIQPYIDAHREFWSHS